MSTAGGNLIVGHVQRCTVKAILSCEKALLMLLIILLARKCHQAYASAPCMSTDCITFGTRHESRLLFCKKMAHNVLVIDQWRICTVSVCPL